MTRLTLPDGTRLAVTQAGAGDPVLLLHGFTGSGASWLDHLPDLTRARRVIAPDLLGHGTSAVATPDRHALDRQAEDMAWLLDHLHAVPADVLGYSMGARLALQLVLDAPGVVRRLILESPAAGIVDPGARAERRHADQRWVDQLAQGDLDGFVRAWARQPIFDSQGGLPPTVRAGQEAERRSSTAAGLAASLRGAGQGVMAPLHARLPQVRVPTLIISGDLDARGTERAAEVAALIPGAVHERIATSGHAAHLESPARFRALVADFLDQPTPAATTA